MSFGSSIAGLFGRSPIKPLQQHYDTVHDCARTLADFFAAVTDNDWDKAAPPASASRSWKTRPTK